MSDRTSSSSSARSLDRRTFVALSGAAGAVGGSLSPALGQAEVLGRPHAPLVAEDDPAISVARPQIRRGSRVLESYYAAPRTAAPATPAVVLAQAIWGIDAQLRDTVRRFAKEGYIALAPDLYSGLGAPSGDGATDTAAFRPFSEKLSDDMVDADLAAAAAFISAGAGGARQKIGVVGFCMGGSIALRQTVDSVGTFAAAAVFYGKVRYGTTGNNGAITPIALAYADRIGTPLCGSWGATTRASSWRTCGRSKRGCSKQTSRTMCASTTEPATRSSTTRGPPTGRTRRRMHGRGRSPGSSST